MRNKQINACIKYLNTVGIEVTMRNPLPRSEGVGFCITPGSFIVAKKQLLALGYELTGESQLFKGGTQINRTIFADSNMNELELVSELLPHGSRFFLAVFHTS